MSKWFIYSFLLLCSFSFARDVEETFLQANREYQNKQYEKALELYTQIGKKGPATWCNMGNCSFRLKKYVDALVCWRRAKKNASRTELVDLNKNITVVNQLLGRAPKAGFFEQRVDDWLGRFSLLVFQLVFLVAWILLFLILFFFKKYKFLFLSVLFPINLLFGFTLFAKYRLEQSPHAVVVRRDAAIFAGPDQNYAVLGKPGFAQEVRVVLQDKNWCKVKGNCLAGWMLADTLEII